MNVVLSRRGFLEYSSAVGILGLGLAGAARSADTSSNQRLSISEFSRNLQMLADLRAAVSKMRGLPPRHPFSWVFQANIHWRPFFPEYVYQQADESDDPAMQVFRDNTGFSPESPVFNTCPHGNWWFLPWHRAYLFYFERILKWASGNSELALPYWNYGVPDQRSLPAVFRSPTISATDQSPNPLYLPSTVTFRDRNSNPQIFTVRDQSLNLGLSALTDAVTSTNALSVIPFTNAAPNAPQDAFASPQACDITCGCGSGALERVPHNLVHVAIGGAAVASGETVRVGFMGDVATAARDPLFWLHHCQIDRLWESWLALADGRYNPSDPGWLDYEFSFYDVGEDGKPVPVSISPAQLLDTTSLGYRYDSLETLDSPSVQPRTILAGGRFRVLGQTSQEPVAMQAVSDHGSESSGTPLSLSEPLRMEVALAKSIQPKTFRELVDRSAEKTAELLLSIEGIRLAHQPGVYFDVYVGLPNDELPTTSSEHYVGTLSFFGSGHHSFHHAGTTKRLQPEMLIIPEKLRNKLAEDPQDAAVTFVPQTGVELKDKTGVLTPRSEEIPAVTVEKVKLLLVN